MIGSVVEGHPDEMTSKVQARDMVAMIDISCENPPPGVSQAGLAAVRMMSAAAGKRMNPFNHSIPSNGMAEPVGHMRDLMHHMKVPVGHKALARVAAKGSVGKAKRDKEDEDLGALFETVREGERRIEEGCEEAAELDQDEMEAQRRLEEARRMEAPPKEGSPDSAGSENPPKRRKK